MKVRTKPLKRYDLYLWEVISFEDDNKIFKGVLKAQSKKESIVKVKKLNKLENKNFKISGNFFKIFKAY